MSLQFFRQLRSQTIRRQIAMPIGLCARGAEGVILGNSGVLTQRWARGCGAVVLPIVLIIF